MSETKSAANSVKLCTTCGKPGAFSKDKSKKDGLRSDCKTCESTRSRARNRQPKVWAAAAWRNLNRRAGNADGLHPAYVGVQVRMTREEFLAWVVPVLTQWQVDNPDKSPSIDRKENSGHYELSNIRLLSVSDNSKRQRIARIDATPAGQAWCRRCKNYQPVANFYPDRRRRGGRRSCCKECLRREREHDRAQKKLQMTQSQ